MHLADAAEPVLIAALNEIDGQGVALWDDDFRRKQPDWSYDDEWSGKIPADLETDHRRPE